jgi:hypothetical protein
MTPHAHPTPDLTVTARLGQFLAQAPHSMQASRSLISALRPFEASKPSTPWGHTSMQVPHPVQRA